MREWSSEFQSEGEDDDDEEEDDDHTSTEASAGLLRPPPTLVNGALFGLCTFLEVVADSVGKQHFSDLLFERRAVSLMLNFTTLFWAVIYLSFFRCCSRLGRAITLCTISSPQRPLMTRTKRIAQPRHPYHHTPLTTPTKHRPKKQALAEPAWTISSSTLRRPPLIKAKSATANATPNQVSPGTWKLR